MTERGHVITIRVFVRWCEGIEAVEDGLSERILIPVIDEEEEVKDTQLESQRAELVLENLERLHYCSRENVTLALIWHTMARLGAVRALDLRDFEPEEQYVQFRHRPSSRTPLKSNHKSERRVALSDEILDLLEVWIEKKRPEVVDD